VIPRCSVPRLPALVVAAAAFLLATQAFGAEGPAPNTLTDAERAEGWRLLFDGRTTAGWRGFRRETFPATGWTVQDGCLRHLPKGGGGDIVTVEKYDDYEFAFEWWIEAGGNGGVKYFITEERAGTATGHEYQTMGEASLDEVRRNRLHATASFYDVLPVSADAAFPLRPPTSWNQSRIVVRGNSVEHWLNGTRVLAYELGSDAVKAGIARSKFRSIPDFGTKFPHRILLQDHGGDIRFRNLKLRPLTPSPAAAGTPPAK
jgi:hypothetical protein